MKGKKFGEGVAASVERVMAGKIDRGTAIDVSSAPRIADRYYVLTAFDPKQDYVDLARKIWIRSIGEVITATGFALKQPHTCDTEHVKRGTILASPGNELTAMAGVKCVWQR